MTIFKRREGGLGVVWICEHWMISWFGWERMRIRLRWLNDIRMLDK